MKKGEDDTSSLGDLCVLSLNKQWETQKSLAYTLIEAQHRTQLSYAFFPMIEGANTNFYLCRAHTRTLAATHTNPVYWVQRESCFQTISLSNTLALTDRRRQICRTMATVECESRWWEESVCALEKLFG